MRPKVSVVVPVFNSQEWLLQTIDSLISQTLTEWEVIFVLDGPNPESRIILDQYIHDHRFLILEQVKKGSGSSRNLGVKHSKGEFLFFLDSDDLMPPNSLDIAYHAAIKHDADVVLGDFRVFQDQKRFNPKNLPSRKNFNKIFSNIPQPFTRSDIQDEILFYDSIYFMVVWLKLFRKETWDQNRILFPENISMAEDFIAVKAMIFCSERIVITKNVMVYHRKRRSSLTSVRSIESFDIFKSFNFSLKVYNNLNLPRSEILQLHLAYMRWFKSHFLRYTRIQDLRKFFDLAHSSVRDSTFVCIEETKFSRLKWEYNLVLSGSSFSYYLYCLSGVLSLDFIRIFLFSKLRSFWLLRDFNLDFLKRTLVCVLLTQSYLFVNFAKALDL